LYADLSVRENIDFYGRIYGLSARRLSQRREEVTQLTGIGNRLGQLAGTLSGGWKQRLALACSLIHEPDVIYLDEPTAGIDPVARRELWDLLFELSGRGVTLLVTTHYMDEAERCTDVGYLFLSRLLVLGKPETLKNLPQVIPPGTIRYDLKVPQPTRQLALLRKMEGVQDATLFGERIHLLVDEKLKPQQLAVQLALQPNELEYVIAEPSLEDVFVTLTKNAERRVEAEASHGAPMSDPFLEIQQDDPLISQEDIQVEVPQMLDDDQKDAGQHAGELATTTGPSPKQAHSRRRSGLAGLWAILVKEFFHIRRQPTTLFFMFLVPVMQTIIFGYAINTQIENIPTVVLDLDGRTQAQLLIERFANTRRFAFIDRVYDQDSFDHAMRSGKAQVGIVVPPDFSERLLMGEQTQVQVLIDGSDSQVASTAQSTAQLLGQTTSIELARRKGESLQLAPARDDEGNSVLPIEIRTRLLFNPDLDSSHFFVPGLVGVILQLVTLFLTSFAVVRERELGTLEQLFVTPVGRSGLMLGKLLPYAIVGIVEVLIMLTVMIYVFGVPISGSILLLFWLSLLFTICSLGLGLFISTIARTQLEAFQFAFIIMLPSILLSGFVFPRAEMPLPIYLASFALPATYFIEILRGIILRGATLTDLSSSVVGLTICCVVVLSASIMRFRKRLG
jgi:ABC transporter DrrB family efflux protein